MNEIVNYNSEVVMTSLEIARLTSKEHKSILRDIRDESDKLGELAQHIFVPSNYLDKNNQERPMYKLNSKGVLQLGARYSAETRFKLISRVEELSKPKTLTQKELLMMQLESLEKIEKLEEENEIQKQVIAEFKPIKEYVDTILTNEDTMTITQIGADYGLSAKTLNKILYENRVIRKVGVQWILYIEHMNKGYTKSETFAVLTSEGKEKLVSNTKWTQKGRLFIHNLLGSLGIKANMDKENCLGA